MESNLRSSPCSEASPPNPSREVAGDTIVFRDTQIGSSAVYQCNASNEHGYLLANAFVSVLGESTGMGASKPQISIESKDGLGWKGPQSLAQSSAQRAGCAMVQLTKWCWVVGWTR